MGLQGTEQHYTEESQSIWVSGAERYWERGGKPIATIAASDREATSLPSQLWESPSLPEGIPVTGQHD